MALVGSAYDPEDGSLEGSHLSWTSSLDGDLGTGELLFAPDLSRGQHTITVTARDSEGNEGSASIRIKVVLSVYLPVLMRGG